MVFDFEHIDFTSNDIKSIYNNINFLIDQGKKDSGYALSWSVYNGYNKITKLLVKNRATDIEAFDNYAFKTAITKSNYEIVELLLNEGANPGMDSGYWIRYAKLNDIEMAKILKNKIDKRRKERWKQIK